MKTQENRFIFKHSPDKPSFEKPKVQPVAEDFIRERQGAGPGAEVLVAQNTPEKQKEVPPIPDQVRKGGAENVVKWLIDGGHLKPADLRQFLGETKEGSRENPLLTHLRSGYESLPAKAFLVGVKPKWETVAAKLTPEVLSKISKLEAPRIYGVNSGGQLLIGDGGTEVPAFTLNKDYFKARNAATSAGLSLMTKEEYQSFNTGTMEVEKTWTWLESGEAPALALRGAWDGYVVVVERYPERRRGYGGARRVLRVSGF